MSDEKQIIKYLEKEVDFLKHVAEKQNDLIEKLERLNKDKINVINNAIIGIFILTIVLCLAVFYR